MDALLDPATLACHAGLGRLAVRETVDTLLSLTSDERDEGLELLVSHGLFDHLSREGLFPLRSTYEAALTTAGIYEIAGADLAAVALNLMQRAKVMEDVVLDFDLTGCTCSTGGGLAPICGCHPAIEPCAEEALHVYGAFAEVDAQQQAIFFASPRQAPQRVESRLQYRSILSAHDEIFEHVSHDASLPVARSLRDSLHSLDPAHLLQRAGVRDDMVRIAVQAAATQMDPAASVPEWLVGPEFCDHLVAMGVATNLSLLRKALRACGEILLGSATASSHWLRTGSGGNAPQLRRAGAAAWRQDVDRDVHIHFWVHANGTIEVASFAGHDYMDIPPPTRLTV